MKKHTRFPLILYLLLLFCFHNTSCSNSEILSYSQELQENETLSSYKLSTSETHENPSKNKQKFTSVTFSSKDNPELDFGIWDHDGEYTIRDFSFTRNDTILLLQMTGIISEYDFSGNLIGIYDYKLSEQGLTAFRICSGNQETLYLLDGHNNSIITCNREKIVGTSYVNWTDLGLVGNYFDCDKDGKPCLSAADPTIRVQGNVVASFTYTLNVDDDHVVVEDVLTGRGIAGGFSFQIRTLDETLGTREIYIDIYRDNILDCTISVSSVFPENKPIIGAELIGVIKDQYLIKITEVIYPSDSIQYYISSTYILVDKISGKFQSCECTIDANSIIRYIDSETFYLSRMNDIITITSIEESCHNFSPTDRFIVSVSN